MRSGRLIYVLWNTWKERNRRIFIDKCLTYREMAHLAFDEFRLAASALHQEDVGDVDRGE